MPTLQSTTATCDGWLKKRSSKGVWQSRYFSVRAACGASSCVRRAHHVEHAPAAQLKNGFLNYYGSTDQKALLASISLASVSARARCRTRRSCAHPHLTHDPTHTHAVLNM